RAIEVESLRVVASSGLAAGPGGDGAPAAETPGAIDLPIGLDPSGGGDLPSLPPCARQRAFIGGRWREVPAYERSALAAGASFPGPALVVEAHTATVVEEGWTCRRDEAAALVLRRQRPPSGPPGPYTWSRGVG
ncbi:MAG TPA: hypothetical protein VHG32_13970, partial [Thermoanaerobaculia bacterium]|nr:hypothetical protein [Thermoanaerobaculia bacterium]